MAAPQGLAEGTCHWEDTGDMLSARPRSLGAGTERSLAQQGGTLGSCNGCVSSLWDGPHLALHD